MTTTARILALLLLGLVLATAAGGTRSTALPADDDLVGNASAAVATKPPNDAVQAAFTRRSYAPGSTAVLQLRGGAPGLTLRLFHAGAGGDGPLQGAPVSVARAVTTRRVELALGTWPSGLYYARLDTPGKGVWYAPFVLRPKWIGTGRLGTARIAVVLPTNTWQAYNYEDGNSWYLNIGVHTIDLTRPFVDGGVPPHYTGYDRGFIRWLALHHEQPDFLTDDDLDSLRDGGALARAYRLVVFSGHEEYVTKHEFDVVERFRDLGGNLAFLSANNFFYKVEKHGDLMHGRVRWRDVGRPEASLVGAEYVDWNHGIYKNRPYTVTGAAKAPWLFKGTELRDGSSFGVYGIEIDAVMPSSPPRTRVLAQIRDIFGAGRSAQMTYYTTPKGSRVFDAGVMNFGGSALWPEVSPLIANIWSYLGTSADNLPSPTR
jgi:N,N-dimethylformamidase beta subunit-like protein